MPGLSLGAITFLVIELLFFLFLVYSIQSAKQRLAPALAGLNRSLRLSEDLFGDERSFVTSARTRYRRAAERIEDVDAHAIASGELSSHEIFRVTKWRVNIGALNELMGSAPGVFITIGLLGTFLGLALNLNQLGMVLEVSDGASASPGKLVDSLAGILAPMSTAFISSLGGVFFSLLFWLTSLILGANRLFEETETLLTAYLEQVVQADCNRFSMTRASLERIELCFADFMSRFSERVGQAIDDAMTAKVQEVFSSIKKGADSLVLYAEVMDEGARKFADSGNSFHKAAEVFSRSTFATQFGDSVSCFLNATDDLASSASNLATDINTLSDRTELIEKGWGETRDSILLSTQMASDIIESTTRLGESMFNSLTELKEATKQIRSARLAIGKENKTSDELSRSLINEISELRPSREDHATMLQALSKQLQDKTLIDSRIIDLLEKNLRVESLGDSERYKLNALLDSLLQATGNEVQ